MRSSSTPGWWVAWQEALPETLQATAFTLHSLLTSAHPQVQVKQTYGIPFYYLHERRFAYLNLPRNGKQLRLCFNHGWRLHPMPRVLKGAQKSLVRYVSFSSEPKETDLLIATSYIQEALIIAEAGLPESKTPPQNPN